MNRRQTDKHAKHALKRLVEQAIVEACEMQRPGFWLCVDDLVASGRPVSRIRIWATMHFYPGGIPGRCHAPCCNFLISTEERERIADLLRRALGLRHAPTLTIRLWLNVHDDFRPRQRVPLFDRQAR